MNFNVCQNITINYLRVNNVTNSSILQIGSAGSIRALSQLYNSGGFTGPAPELGPGTSAETELSLVRLPGPS